MSVLPHSNDTLDGSHQLLLGLCDSLEDIADALPYQINPVLCGQVAERLERLVQNTHQLEEDVLFPQLIAGGGTQAQSIIKRLRHEHVIDSGAANEIADALTTMVRTGRSQAPETLGYLLRSFFESVRRHVQSERELARLFVIRPPSHDGSL